MKTSALRRLNLIAWAALGLSVAACGGAPDTGTEENRAPLSKSLEEAKPLTVGGASASDTLVAPGGYSIFSAFGSFPSVTGVTGVTDSQLGLGAYSVQLNTNFFPTRCSLSAPANDKECQGVEQFVYAVGSQSIVFIEYWVIGVKGPCDAGWSSNAAADGTASCVFDTPSVAAPRVSIANLSSLALSGSVTSSGSDVATLTTAAGTTTASGPDYFGLAGGGWNVAEFNVFGEEGGSNASLSFLTKITVGVSAAYGPRLNDYAVVPPTCGSYGTTAETNNLILGSCTPYGGLFGLGLFGHAVSIVRYPGIEFTEAAPRLRILPPL